MWPGCPPLRASTSRTSASTTSHGRQAQRRVEVALHAPRRRRPARGPRRAARASRRPPRRRPRPRIRPSSSPVPTPKWMRGHAEVGDARRRPAATVRAARSARSRPAISAPAQLSNSCTAAAPALDLRPQRRDGQVGQPVHERVPQRRVAVHQRLGARVGARRPALDQVAGHRERRAGEADQRHVELARRGSAPSRARRACRPRARAGAGGRGRPPTRNGLLDDRADAGRDVDAEADGGDRHDDVGVEDGGVDAVAAHRLQGDLGRQLGLADGVEDAAAAADGAVLGQRPARLAHEPHRHPVVGAAREPAARVEERRQRVRVGADRRHAATLASGAHAARSRAIETPMRPRRNGQIL